MHRVLVLNGPNLNLLGVREPHLYGTDTLADVERLCRSTGRDHGLEIDFRQSNHEGVLVDAVQEARTAANAVVINPAGYGGTSVALLDALLAVEVPVVEVHLTNIHKREAYRHRTHVSQAAAAVICGAGAHGYVLALLHIAHLMKRRRDVPDDATRIG